MMRQGKPFTEQEFANLRGFIEGQDAEGNQLQDYIKKLGCELVGKNEYTRLE